jgi:hypothetical protein
MAARARAPTSVAVPVSRLAPVPGLVPTSTPARAAASARRDCLPSSSSKTGASAATERMRRGEIGLGSPPNPTMYTRTSSDQRLVASSRAAETATSPAQAASPAKPTTPGAPSTSMRTRDPCSSVPTVTRPG